MRRKLNLLGVGIVTGLLTYYSTYSPTGGTSGSSNLLLHVLAYFGLAAVLALYFYDTRAGPFEAAVFAVIVGIFLEVQQYFIPNRYFGLVDIAANLLGASLILIDYKANFIPEIVETEEHVLQQIFDTN